MVNAVVFCLFTDDSSNDDHDNDLAVNLQHSCSKAKSPKKSTSNKKSTTMTTKAKSINFKSSNTATKDRKKKRKLTILPDTSADDEEASLIEVFDVGHKCHEN